jgi:predicted Fe-Mo cluster-binding NifX family protein
MKILVTVNKSHISPRFDLTIETLIAACEDNHLVTPFRTLLLTRPSADELCSLIMKENIDIIICGGIEEKHLKYLTWKKVKVIHSVIGSYAEALNMAIDNQLENGCILPSAVVR